MVEIFSSWLKLEFEIVLLKPNPFSKTGGWHGDVVTSRLVQMFNQFPERKELSLLAIQTLFKLQSFTELLGVCLYCNRPPKKARMNCTSV